jgi:lipoprotein signal peptidase
VRTAVVAAGLVVVATLVHDAVVPSTVSHERSAALYVFAVAIAGSLLAIAPRIGSRAVSLGAGLGSGGAIATTIAGTAWAGGVPNPLVYGDVAFNLADVAIGVGVALLVGGALVHAWRNRDRLHEAI